MRTLWGKQAMRSVPQGWDIFLVGSPFKLVSQKTAFLTSRASGQLSIIFCSSAITAFRYWFIIVHSLTVFFLRIISQPFSEIKYDSYISPIA